MKERAVSGRLQRVTTGLPPTTLSVGELAASSETFCTDLRRRRAISPARAGGTHPNRYRFRPFWMLISVLKQTGSR